MYRLQAAEEQHTDRLGRLETALETVQKERDNALAQATARAEAVQRLEESLRSERHLRDQAVAATKASTDAVSTHLEQLQETCKAGEGMALFPLFHACS